MSSDRPLTLRKSSEPHGLTPPRPVLHLSGPKLRSALERLIGASEALGGVERFAEAVRLKSAVFQDRLADGKAAGIARAEFDEIVPLMATVRRRIAPLLEPSRWPHTRAAIVALLDCGHDTTIADQRIATFESALRSLIPPPSSQGGGEGRRSTRFLRDLATEILHNTLPEYYPLMNRWIWDNKANSGVVREIWHDPASGDDVDHIVIDIPDGYEMHLVLREELSQFLADNGVFRDMLWHVDLLCAQIYGDYINAQGGAWLKTEFGSVSDPLEHSRRILGLDRVARGSRASVSGEWSVVSGAIGKDG
jgi:hypothetical protein